MKYIDADRLKAEIERREVILDKYKDSFETAACCKQELEWMKDFITSIQQEQPEADLELEIERIIKNEEKFMKFQVRHQLIGYVARHFAEWGATHLNARKED